ncbi:MAG: hypothetical protein ABI301_01200 [Jatrophihabitantaceae bacterium]
MLRFANESDGWAGVDQLYSTHDGGATWTREQLGGATSVVTDIETGGGYVFANTTTCPSSGDCTRASRVYASPIGRDKWQAVSTPLSGDATPGGLTVHGSDWYLPLDTGIYHGHGTSAPIRAANPCPADGSYRASPTIAVADSAHLDALCQSQGAAGSASYQLYGTTDGGRRWVKAGPSRIQASGLFGITDNGRGVLLEAVASGGSAILRTTDDGATIRNSSISAPSGGLPWADLGFTTATQAVVVLAGTAIYLSHDSGASFDRITF